MTTWLYTVAVIIILAPVAVYLWARDRIRRNKADGDECSAPEGGRALERKD